MRSGASTGARVRASICATDDGGPPGERLASSPSALYPRLITCSVPSAVTISRQRPPPAPNRPSSPSPPFSSCAAVTARASPGSSVRPTSPSGGAEPESSTPPIETRTSASPRFDRCSRLSWPS